MYSALVAHLARVGQMANALNTGGAGVVAGGVASAVDFKNNPSLDVSALGVWGLKSAYNFIFGKDESVDVDKNISEISDYYAKKREAQIIEANGAIDNKTEVPVSPANNNNQPINQPLTLLGILNHQNSILQVLSLNLAVLGIVKSKTFESQSISKKENLNNQPLEIRGRVVSDAKTGYLFDPKTRKLYDPITGDRILDSTSSSVENNGAVSSDVNFKEVLKSQASINSEISKYIFTIGENQKIYNQNLIKVAENSAKLVDSTKGYSQAMRDGLSDIKLNADVKIRNTLNASLSIDRPVEISLPASYAENQKILSENSTKTLEIYKEKAEYDKTSVAIKDLDGNTIAKASPREIALSRQAVQARTYTDENNFELDNEALDLFDLPMPNFKDLFDTELPSKSLFKDMK